MPSKEELSLCFVRLFRGDKSVFGLDGFRKYFANTGWLFLAQLFSMLIAFFVGVLVARHLGPNLYGIFNYALSLSTIVGMFFCSSLDFALSRELIKRPEDKEKLLGTFWLIKLVGGLLTMVISLAIAWVGHLDSLTIKLLVVLSVFYVFQSANIIGLFFQAQVMAKRISQAQIISNIISSVIKIGWLFSGLGIVWLAAIYVFDIFLNGLFLLNFYQSAGERISRWRFDRHEAGYILVRAWPLMLSGFLIYAILRIDQVIIGFLLNKTAVGYYAVADRLTEIWDFIPKLICISLFPAIISAHKASADLYEKRKKLLYLLMLALSLAIVALVVLLARPVIIGLFGQEYQASVKVLQVYVLSLPGIFLFTAMNQSLLAENREKIIFLANLLGLTINIVLNFILLPQFGLLGSAWATVITFIFLPLFIFKLSSSRHKS